MLGARWIEMTALEVSVVDWGGLRSSYVTACRKRYVPGRLQYLADNAECNDDAGGVAREMMDH